MALVNSKDLSVGSNIQKDHDISSFKNIFDRAYSNNMSAQLINLKVSDVEIEDQIRSAINSEEITELADSIKEHGLINPITVYQREDGKYQLISGEKRYRACCKLGMKEVLANVFTFKNLPNYDRPTQVMLVQITENLHRSNPTFSDYVRAVDRLRAKYPDLTGTDLMEILCKGRSYSFALLAFSKLTENEKEKLLRAGSHHLQKYMDIKKVNTGAALDIVDKADSLTDEQLKALISSQYALNVDGVGQPSQDPAKKGKKAAKAEQGEKEKSASVNLKKINKIIDGLGDSVQAYMDEYDMSFDQLVATALEDYLASH